MLRREVRFHPGYDYTEADAGKPWGQQRGVHGMECAFYLHGDEGVVQFKFGTDWLPTWVEEGTETWMPLNVKPRPSVEVHNLFPMAVDLGYHWPTPRYEEQTRLDCHLLEQGFCYYDGSGLNAEKLLGLLLTKGDEAVWAEMEEYYAYLTTGVDA